MVSQSIDFVDSLTASFHSLSLIPNTKQTLKSKFINNYLLHASAMSYEQCKKVWKTILLKLSKLDGWVVNSNVSWEVFRKARVIMIFLLY